MRLGIDQVAIGLLGVSLATTAVRADEIFLRGGGRLTGIVVERTKDNVVVETGPGRVTLRMSRVDRIVEAQSALEVYHERADALDPGNVTGWADLARWAADRDLVTQSREAWRRILATNPSHAEANAALGRVQVDGTWLGQEEAYRARGYVNFDGRWVTPAEHEALVRERALEETSLRERREVEFRVREAEARARVAEAQADEAEAAAQPAEGIPWWGAGGGWYGGGGAWSNGGWSSGGYGVVIRSAGDRVRSQAPVARPASGSARPATPPTTRPPHQPKKPSRIDPPPPKPRQD